MVEKPAKSRPRLFLIDGYALIYRAFFAMIARPLTTIRGENTSAAFGFTRFIQMILTDHEPDYLAVVLDAGKSDREILYPAYKATREKMPDDLQFSMARIREIVDAMRIPVIQLENHEADDVIGTLAVQAVEQGLEAVIVSGDKDFYQMIRPHISLLNPGRGGSAMVEEEWVDERNARERLGVAPEHVTDYLALIGDSSDNIPGARGIGPKTAIQLIEEMGSVEKILANTASIKGKRPREALETARADVLLSKELVTIRSDLPIQLDLSEVVVKEPDRARLRDIFLALEFNVLAREYAPVEETKPMVGRYELVDTLEGMRLLVQRARREKRLSLHVGGTSRQAMRAEPAGIGVAFEPGEAFYLPLAHRDAAPLDLSDLVRAPVKNLPPLSSPDMRPLVDLLGDATIRKIGHDLKHHLIVLRRAGVALRGLFFDTMVASYVVEPGRREHTLDSLALQHLNYRTTSFEDLCGKSKDQIAYAEVDVARCKDYAAQEADLPLRLQQQFQEEMERAAVMSVFRDIEMPLIEVLAEMEWAGIRIEPIFFGNLERKLSRDLQLVQEEIFKLSGGEFNISSTQQLREVLFDRLDLPIVKKTKTGASTDVNVLEELAALGYELPRLVIEYRQMDKLKGTYVDALPQLIHPQTRRIHTTFNQTVAATGRLSSNDPNLQNIPIRTETGAEIRKGFVPAEGFMFVSADYSQIELRILAHMSKDAVFTNAFQAGADIHRQTAAAMFDVPLSDVSPQMRAAAKTVNFATIYGIGPFALSGKLGTTVAEAKDFISRYFERFPGVRGYLDEQIAKARELGFVETIAGRRRYIPEVRSNNYSMRQFGERAATNAPVQGSAADIIKIAMVHIQRALTEQRSDARMLLQVHDELVFEVPRGEVDMMRPLVKDLMEGAFKLDVPLEVASGVGENWYECK
jgi:DNA polymerase-1